LTPGKPADQFVRGSTVFHSEALQSLRNRRSMLCDLTG
jgi:hypothetical protein